MSPAFSSKHKRAMVLLAAVVLLSGLYPVRYLAAPRWEVWVVNEAGVPLQDVSVRLSYKNYSAESDSHEITLTTDSTGHVLFSQQYGWACLIQEAFYIAAAASGGVHASFGRHAFVFVFGRGYDGTAVSGNYVTDWSCSPAEMVSKITARRTN
jgi:hypothetical protein